MSIASPIFGIDVSHWQQAFDFGTAYKQGYRFALIKASEGPYRDGSRYTDPAYRTHTANALDAGMVVGAYHFLVETPAKAQVEHFLSVVGDARGKMLVIDYEAYPNFPALSPTEATLRAFAAELRRRLPRHPIIVYSGKGYWDSPPANGSIKDLNVTTWDAYYPLGDEVIGTPQSTYKASLHFKGWGERWGNQEPMFWQFTPAGSVSGQNVDVDAFRGTMSQLKALARVIDVDLPHIVLQPGPAHDPGSGPYVEAHPTHYRFRDDVRALAEKYINLPQFRGKVWANTYLCHPPPWCLDSTSVDFWDWDGRGHTLSEPLKSQLFDVIFNDPALPLIRWTIHNGWMWSRSGGWQRWSPPEDGSDPGHWRHIHVTFS